MFLFLSYYSWGVKPAIWCFWTWEARCRGFGGACGARVTRCWGGGVVSTRVLVTKCWGSGADIVRHSLKHEHTDTSQQFVSQSEEFLEGANLFCCIQFFVISKVQPSRQSNTFRQSSAFHPRAFQVKHAVALAAQRVSSWISSGVARRVGAPGSMEQSGV